MNAHGWVPTWLMRQKKTPPLLGGDRERLDMARATSCGHHLRYAKRLRHVAHQASTEYLGSGRFKRLKPRIWSNFVGSRGVAPISAAPCTFGATAEEAVRAVHVWSL